MLWPKPPNVEFCVVVETSNGAANAAEAKDETTTVADPKSNLILFMSLLKLIFLPSALRL